MNNVTYLVDEKLTLEGQIELVEEYEKLKDNPDYDEFARAEGLTELSNLEIKLNLLKAIKETNASNDIKDSKTIINIFRSIQEGNQNIINSIEEYTNSIN